MTKVKDLKYARFTIDDYRNKVEPKIAEAEKAESFEALLKAREEILKTDSRFSTMASLARARYTLDTRDEFYVKETEYYDSVYPLRNELFTRYLKAFALGKFKDEVSEKFSPAIIKTCENAAKAISPAIIEDRQKEAAVVLEYSKLMSTMQFEFDGKTMPLSALRGRLSDENRETRKRTAFAIGEGLRRHRDELDDIFDRLVRIRNGMAKKLGFENYVALGYLDMNRMDYDRKDVENFRANVLKSLVPVVKKAKLSLKNKLGLDKFMFYDNAVSSASGETKLLLSDSETFEAAQSAYDTLDPEIGRFMKFMRETEAFDVTSRDGKWGGGYCTEFYDYAQPFILANWNGSCDDVDVLTHEFGHALASMYAMKGGIYELGVGGMETAECHSMGMELFCHPFMDGFFGKDANLYRRRHLLSAIGFIPYGCIVDEFQHIIYSEPNLTPKERNAVFKDLSRKYMPYMTYDGIPYLEEGTRWQYQMHIYESPFYYIDYCLAQTVALEFYAASLKNYPAALEKYIAFVKSGGKTMFKDLVRRSGLKSPFSDHALDEVAEAVLIRLDELEEK